jgi:hypothetical protein
MLRLKNAAAWLRSMPQAEWFHLRLNVLTVLPLKARLVAKSAKGLT